MAKVNKEMNTGNMGMMSRQDLDSSVSMNVVGGNVLPKMNKASKKKAVKKKIKK